MLGVLYVKKYVVNMDGNVLEVVARNSKELYNFLFSMFDLYSLEIVSESDSMGCYDYPTIERVVKTIPTVV